VVVDPGDAAPVQAYLDREALDLAAIVATHHHGDHVGGIEALVARRHVPVYGPAREAIPARTRALREGDRVVLDQLGLELRVLDVPGHTAGHVAYTGDVAGAPVLFCGDTLFAAGCGRIFEGTPAMLWTSLAKLAALDPATRVFCAHEYTLANLRFAAAVEPANAALAQRAARDAALRERGQPTVPSTIADELATNPFLRAGEAVVRAAAEAHAGHSLDGEVAVFAELRAWKNAFR
jgi:hydroxyacylglutathione hydrolase